MTNFSFSCPACGKQSSLIGFCLYDEQGIMCEWCSAQIKVLFSIEYAPSPSLNPTPPTSPSNASGPHCEGACKEHTGEVSQVNIASGYMNWGEFWYCESAIAEDERRGFTVIRLTLHEADVARAPVTDKPAA